MQQNGEQLLRTFLHLDDELGGNSLYEPLALYVRRMAVTVRSDPRDGLSAFGQLNQMAGWLALDASNHVAAKRHFTEAAQVGHEAGEPALVASAMAYMSLQETYRGRRKPALSLAQTALEVSSRKLTPLTRAMLGTRLARAHAAMENAGECLRALETVCTDFDQAGGYLEPVYVSYVDIIEITAQRGACYLELGMLDDAVDCLAKALELIDVHAPSRVRDKMHYLSRLAKGHLLDGEVEQACFLGHRALEIGQAIGSARVAERLKEFKEALRPFGRMPCAQEFIDQHTWAARTHTGSGNPAPDYGVAQDTGAGEVG